MTEEKSRERGAVVPLSKELTTDRALAVGSIEEIGQARQLCAEIGRKWKVRTLWRWAKELQSEELNSQGRQGNTENVGTADERR
jgi:hypothetical protein